MRAIIGGGGAGGLAAALALRKADIEPLVLARGRGQRAAVCIPKKRGKLPFHPLVGESG
jgi:predicted NAD/FAD-dependent oxidoreductase